MGIPVPVVALELPSYQRKENFGTDETFYQLVRALAHPVEKTPEVTANLIGPLALGFRHRDDIEEVKGLLYEMGIGINVVAPFDATPEDLTRSARPMSTC
jgi:light-independent protochlorophyllide reductase subunit B